MKYWLMKTEPSVFSWDDLRSHPAQTTQWEGVRNYQARNFMRDQMKVDDLVFFYHSAIKQPAIMGTAQVVREAYPDPFAFDKESPYYDPKSNPDNPRWVTVDIQYRSGFQEPITLDELKQVQGLESMMLLRKGSRLSVQPILPEEWKTVCNLRP